ncbi:MAG TPA: arsenite methyltransferase [Anaerolineales bacterium]|nr:arsenite methyltransferase [Anaerolineales bacterium]
MVTKKITEKDNTEIRKAVRDRYAKAATEAGSSCCDGDCCSEDIVKVEQLYQAEDVLELPKEITGMSMGCGDPITLAALSPGQTVLDLGSGGGIDCFLAARRVGPTGRVIGVDMTPEMLEKARENQKKLEASNTEFRLGEIEHLPVADEEIDVVISNCVINLSTDKPQVFQEAFRVLKPGGKLAVSDIVTDGPLPDAVKADLSAWAGCIAGAWDVAEYVRAINEVGFVEISVDPVYMEEEWIDDAAEQLGLQEALDAAEGVEVQKSIFSAKITAWKPEK